jgi:hypothetical protein
MKVIECYDEQVAVNFQKLTDWISGIEILYQNRNQVTRTLSTYQKHPTQNIWFFVYKGVYDNIGVTGQEIMTFFFDTPNVNVFNPQLLRTKVLTKQEEVEYFETLESPK